MKRLMKLTRILFVLACVASMLAFQAPSALPHNAANPEPSVEHTGASQPDGALDRIGSSKLRVSDVYGSMPRSFEPNCGQTNAEVKFLSRGSGYDLYLTANEAVIQLRSTTKQSSRNGLKDQQAGEGRPSVVRMKLAGASNRARIVGVDRLPGKSNYFIGSDPKKWRTNIPNFSRVKYENIYPGVDVVFYGEHGQLEYDLRVAPGADVKTVRIAFDGVRRVRLDGSGDLLIATPSGEIRERKPVIYQEADGARQPVEGGYVIRGEREIGFEVRQYDSNRALVIDPVLVYSTSLGGTNNDNANAVAVDAAGNAYIAGTTTSTDFPTVNPYQAKLATGVVGFIVSDAFVTKLNSAGTAVLYSTYLGGTSVDVANGIVVDAAGNAYLTGYTTSTDFPTTPGAFQINANTGGDAFIAKLNSAGSALAYSTRLGGPPGISGYSTSVNIGRGIAVDAEGSAYVTGYTFSPSFPVKKAVQDKLDRGTIRCCNPICLYDGFSGIIEDAFVTKLNPSGTGLVYSTYVGGTGQEEAYGIALDASGSAYITGRTCSRDFTNGEYGGGKSDAFVLKVSASGKQFVYSSLIGGSGDDIGNSVVVDSAGNAYVAGQTDSINFFTSQSAFQTILGGSVSYVTNDGGGSWTAQYSLPNSPVNVLAIDPTNPLTIYAGLGACVKTGGVFKSTNAGNSWRPSGLAGRFIRAIVIDPQNPSTVYADSDKSTDGGGSWTAMTFPENPPVLGAAKLAIDPVNTTTLYMVSDGGSCGEAVFPSTFLKTTDGGRSWDQVRNGGATLGASSVFIDPKNSSTIYANSGSLLKSTDSGSTWRVPYDGNRTLSVLAIDPTNTSTLYLREFAVSSTLPIEFSENLLKSTDGGTTFVALSLKGPSINSLAIDPANSSILYAATSVRGNPGGVTKSTDGGLTWSATDLTGVSINTLTIDSRNSRLYAGASFDTDGFIAKINQEGSALVYSTYLGTRSPDVVAGIAIDGAGNTYVTGQTLSDRFPTMDALLAIKSGGPFDTSPFVTKLNATASAILFSSYLGNTEPSFSSAIGVDGAGKAYVVGTTGTPAFFPSAILPESAHGGFDAFVIKIASPPRVTGASISGKNLIVTGEGFDKGAVILINGVDQRTKNDGSNPATTLIGKKSAINVPLGASVVIQVRTSDGLLSQPPFSFAK